MPSHGVQAVQVHVLTEVQPVADLGGVAVAAISRAQTGCESASDRVPLDVGRRRDEGQVKMVVAGPRVPGTTVGDKRIVVAVVVPRHADVVGSC